jgi:regulator of sigma E protease
MPGSGLPMMSPEEREVSFHYKRVGQRAAIVAAGPIANFVFAVAVLAGIFIFVGQPFTPPEVGQVQAGSAAERAGMQPGDLIVSIDGKKVERFEDVRQAVSLNTGVPMHMLVRRGGQEQALTVTPQIVEQTDRFGNKHRGGLLGISRNGINYVRYDPLTAAWRAGLETWNLSAGTMSALWEMIIGARPTDELGGPLRIAQMSGEVGQGGMVARLWFMAVLSINLGLINLFPIPVLDGGHLVFYAAEAIRRKPVGQRAQEYGFRIGLALVLTLMVFATWNDLVNIGIVKFFVGLVT